MTVVVKLGGSVLTDKGSPETLDGARLDRLVETIASSDVEDLAIVHGAGSYGHPHAAKRGVSTECGTRDAGDVVAIHRAVRRLNDELVDRLGAAGVPALPVHPLSAAHRDASGELWLPVSAAATMLEEGFVPVAHGDVIAHAGEGVTIVSGDDLVVSLAAGLDADRAGVCSTTPGVLDERGEVVPTIDGFEDVRDLLGASEETDVTGGMAGKVRALLGVDAPAWIFGPDDLAAFLRDESVGTRIE